MSAHRKTPEQRRLADKVRKRAERSSETAQEREARNKKQREKARAKSALAAYDKLRKDREANSRDMETQSQSMQIETATFIGHNSKEFHKHMKTFFHGRMAKLNMNTCCFCEIRWPFPRKWETRRDLGNWRCPMCRREINLKAKAAQSVCAEIPANNVVPDVDEEVCDNDVFSIDEANDPLTFSRANDALPSLPPPLWSADDVVLGKKGVHKRAYPECVPLTRVERLLVARTINMVQFIVVHPHRYAYKGHHISFMKDFEQFVLQIPRHPEKLPIIVVRRGKNSKGVKLKNLYARRAVVEAWCRMLIENHLQYQDVTLDPQALAAIPDNGVLQFPEIVAADENSENDAQNESGPELRQVVGENEARDEVVSSVVLDLPGGGIEKHKIRRALLQIEKNQVRYPKSTDTINEFKCPGLLSMTFPDLFPDGYGDITNPGLKVNKIKFFMWVRRILKWAHKTTDGKGYVYPFQDHHFMYFCLNRMHRHTLLSQTNVYVDQNSTLKGLTVGELKSAIEKDDTNSLLVRKTFLKSLFQVLAIAPEYAGGRSQNSTDLMLKNSGSRRMGLT